MDKVKSKKENGKFKAMERRTTVIIPPEQNLFLDRLALDIREKTGIMARRSQIIRHLISLLAGSDLVQRFLMEYIQGDQD